MDEYYDSDYPTVPRTGKQSEDYSNQVNYDHVVAQREGLRRTGLASVSVIRNYSLQANYRALFRRSVDVSRVRRGGEGALG